MIKTITINNFRGIEEVKNLEMGKFNIFIGDNGTSKTTILEAINYSVSPSFLSGKIKHTDFRNGGDSHISVLNVLEKSITVSLPDGFTFQNVTCNAISMRAKKRDKKSPGKIFSDLVTVEHIVIPNFARGENGWSVKRKAGSNFNFTERLLAVSQVSTNELPRSFYFGKNRDRQLSKGFNTSFSTIIDDLNWRFSRSVRKETEEKGEPAQILAKIPQLEGEIAEMIEFDKYEVFKEFQKRVSSFGVEEINLSILDCLAPYEGAFLSVKREVLNLPLKFLGSGIEMIISLLFLEALATLSKEKLLILIDEPELHLHPQLQQGLSDYLWDISKGDGGHQIFVTTHSPVFFKNCVGKEGVKTFVSRRDLKTSKVGVEEFKLGAGLLPWSPSWGEINYYAYGFSTVEFHDELYGFIQEKTGCFKEQEIDDFLETNFGIKKEKQWTPEKNGTPGTTRNITLPVFIRNRVHHPENKTMQVTSFSSMELKTSIDALVEIVNKIK